jgi:aminoglycoside phosphotransferase (APT) family kinase protein
MSEPIPALDEVALSAWMRENVAGFSGPISIDRFAGGQSNPTFKITTPSRAYVLRRKPPGILLAGAHAIDREVRVMTALGKAGFPVPHVHGLCTDDQVIGSWFYIMDMVEGRIFWDATFPEVTDTDRPRYFDAMNAAITQLHRLDYHAIGLEDFGRAGNFFHRQIARWSRQYVEDVDAGRNPNMDRLIDWLPRNIPDDVQYMASVAHGDFRCDNMIFHPTEPRILAVLDWELSTIGHPMADFTYHAMMYRMPPHIVAGLSGADLLRLNIPSEADYVASYCERMGIEGMPHYAFYMAFNFFRLAAIFHGIRGRVVRGTAASAQARERTAYFPELARLAWAQTGVSE